MRQKICPVDVISLCEADGQIRPLRIRFMDENHNLIRLNVDHILRKDEIRYTGAESQFFLCKTTVDDREWLFRLKYTLRTHSWCITGKLY